MRRVGGCLLAKLAGSGVLRAHEPLLEASVEMAGKLTPVGSQVTASALLSPRAMGEFVIRAADAVNQSREWQ